MTSLQTLQVREMTQRDVRYLVSYWLEATPEFLIKIGVDTNKRPTEEQLINFVTSQIKIPVQERQSYYLTWLINDTPIGHSNVNQIVFGRQAHMHLHLYQQDHRQKGVGTDCIKKSLPFYFKQLEIEHLFCEPYALNPAPNKTLEKVGFEFVKKYKTIPGASNFEQLVNQWVLTRAQFKKIGTSLQ